MKVCFIKGDQFIRVAEIYGIFRADIHAASAKTAAGVIVLILNQVFALALFFFYGF